MQSSMFFKADSLTKSCWFDMLCHENSPLDPTHIFEIQAKAPFKMNDQMQESGIYYIRFSINKMGDLKTLGKVRKLSFSELVYISDLNSSTSLSKSEFRKMIEKGNVIDISNEFSISLTPFERACQKVKQKYFSEKGTFFYRMISGFLNLFRKYDLYKKTGIYWPGNSFNYAEKVIRQVKQDNADCLKAGLKISLEMLHVCLKIPFPTLEQMKPAEVKRVYRQNTRIVHPDKNLNGDTRDQFAELNKAYRAYELFSNLLKNTVLQEEEKQEHLPNKNGEDRIPLDAILDIEPLGLC